MQEHAQLQQILQQYQQVIQQPAHLQVQSLVLQNCSVVLNLHGWLRKYLGLEKKSKIMLHYYL